ncbi:unnamed protein product [Arabis nemorensis]|uniref:Nodulin-like domain-containing protein n=1 Tax=Arabis nemorensis TaxID=586526 RepID=A0A565CTE6_9BRAS|nr:unnamed protein product [Arabis nemorensis]
MLCKNQIRTPTTVDWFIWGGLDRNRHRNLKSVLGYNQQQLTMLGVVNNVGESITFVPGYASTNRKKL